MANKIKIKRDFQSLRIYINDILHLEIRMNNHDGVQSWCEGTKKKMYFIEFYRKQGTPVLMGYENFEDWKTILKLIDENI